MSSRVRPLYRWSVPALLLLATVSCSNSPSAPATSPVVLVLNAQPALLPATGGTALIRATLTDNGNPVVGGTVTFATTAGTLSAESVLTNEAGVADVNITTNGPVTVSATGRTSNLSSFLATAETGVAVTVDTAVAMTVTPSSPRAGDEVTIAVSATSGGQPSPGALIVTLGDGSSRDLGNVNGPVSVKYTYLKEGDFTVTATLSRENKQYVKTAAVNVEGWRPGIDQIDPRSIIWLNQVTTDITDWPIGSPITSISVGGASGETVCISHENRDNWPLVSIDSNPPNLIANLVIVINVDGQWYGAGYDWMRPGADCKTVHPSEFGVDQIRQSPLDASWPGPRSGEVVGLLITTPSSNRVPVRSINERTNIVRVIWP